MFFSGYSLSDNGDEECQINIVLESYYSQIEVAEKYSCKVNLNTKKSNFVIFKTCEKAIYDLDELYDNYSENIRKSKLMKSLRLRHITLYNKLSLLM